MRVMKFGGSSLRDADRVVAVVEIIRERIEEQPIVVCSALGSTTDLLDQAYSGDNEALAKVIRFHRKVCKGLGIEEQSVEALLAELESFAAEKPAAERDDWDYARFVSFGERLSTRVVSAYWRAQGFPGQALDPWEVGFISSSNPREARLGEEAQQQVAEAFAPLLSNYDFTPFVCGFLAKDEQGRITTLGRGGSDLTAVFLGAALEAREVQLWKDVSGLMTADPRLISSSRSLRRVSFEQAAELAYCGAKVLHPLSIQPAMRAGVAVRIMNSYRPQFPGTLIHQTADDQNLVTSLTCKREVTLVDLVSSRMLGEHGFLADVFRIFRDHSVSVDMVATSEVSVSMTLNRGYCLGSAEQELAEIARIKVEDKKAVLSLVGDVSRSSEILGGAFRVLESEDIQVQMVSQGASKVNIGLLVNDSEAEKAVSVLHRYFIEQQELSAKAA